MAKAKKTFKQPKGHKASCQCAVCKASRKGKSPKVKSMVIGAGHSYQHRKPKTPKSHPLNVGSYLPTSGVGTVQHKGYSYVNKKTGKTVHVAPHVEHARLK